MQLTDTDKEYLKKNGYEKDDFSQIEEAMNKSTIALFREDEIDKCFVIDYESARDLLGNDELLSCIARSAFHYSSSREVPHTFGKYSISVDSGVIFDNVPSKLLEKHDENMLKFYKNARILSSSPVLRITGTEWDTSDEEYDYEDVELPSEVFVGVDECLHHRIEDMDDVAEFIGYKIGYCFYTMGELDSNYTTNEIKAMIEKVERDKNEFQREDSPGFSKALSSYQKALEIMVGILEENEMAFDKE